MDIDPVSNGEQDKPQQAFPAMMSPPVVDNHDPASPPAPGDDRLEMDLGSDEGPVSEKEDNEDNYIMNYSHVETPRWASQLTAKELLEEEFNREIAALGEHVLSLCAIYN